MSNKCPGCLRELYLVKNTSEIIEQSQCDILIADSRLWSYPNADSCHIGVRINGDPENLENIAQLIRKRRAIVLSHDEVIDMLKTYKRL